ncbi:MAG: serine/threonine-protein kinase [Candidatus Sumerlaeia bacterium]|nr:serine/threonine-protein kinase [Candidatus Sumerlaeia bacterium]
MLEPQDGPPSDPGLSWAAATHTAAKTGAAPPFRTAAHPVTLATLAPSPEAPGSAPAAQEREQTAAYGLRERIAVGGMGEVWEGVQLSLGRIVAIKRIREDRMHRARDGERDRLFWDFRSEALVAAWLEHPNIAPVYDFGRDADGEPILTMKMVRGRPWSELLREDRESLGMEEYLAKHIPVLVSMAQAVAFAHSRGIVHRDLKPSQVMVGEFGEALLMDWGLAIRFGETPMQPTATVGADAVPSPDTATNPAGTPAFMAPEQTEPDARGVGPHTDIFLLGGTLYHILTGAYLYDSARGPGAVAQARECRVVPPAMRTPGVALPEELCQIAMTALARKPGERQPSARAFVAQLQDYLSGAGRRRHADERVLAAESCLRRTPRGYADLAEAAAALDEAARHWPSHTGLAPLREACLAAQAELALAQGDLSFARVQARAMAQGEARTALERRVDTEERARGRRALLFRAAAVAVVAMALGTAFISVRHSREMRQKNEELSAQKALVEQGRAQAQASREVALTQYRGTGRLVGFMLNDLQGSLDKELPRDREIAQTVARGTSEYYLGAGTDAFDDDLLAEHATQLLAIARAYKDLGLPEDSLMVGESAAEIRARLFGDESPEYGEVLSVTGTAREELGDLAGGLADLRRAVALTERLPAGDMRRFGAVSNLAAHLWSQGELPEALSLAEEALAQAEALPQDDTRPLFHALGTVSGTLVAMNRLDEAMPILDRQEALIAAHPEGRERDLISLLFTRANALRMGGKPPAEVLVPLERALALARTHQGPDHPETDMFANNVALMWQRMGRTEEALAAHMDVFERRKLRFGEGHRDTAISMNNIALLLDDLGRDEEAMDWLDRAIASIEDTAGPDSADIAGMLATKGSMLSEQGRLDEAEPLSRKAIAIREAKLGPSHPATMNARTTLLKVLMEKARLADSTGADSAALWGDAKACLAEYLDATRGVPPIAAAMSEVLLRTGDLELAREQATAAAGGGFGSSPEDPDQARFLTICEELGVTPPAPPEE